MREGAVSLVDGAARLHCELLDGGVQYITSLAFIRERKLTLSLGFPVLFHYKFRFLN